MTQKTYIGKGSIYFDNGSTGLIPLGNCSKLATSINEETKEIFDFENAGGGLVNSISRISAVELAITCHNFVAENLALATRGAVTARTTTPIVDESLTSKKGTLRPTSRLINTSVAPIVTGTGGTPVYVANTDYVVMQGGIFIPLTSSIADATALLVDYTALADSQMQALVLTSQEFRLVFDGLNEAESGKPAYFEFFRTKFSPSGFDLIGDDFAGFDLKATVLKDATKTGAGISQYFLARIG